MNVPPSSTLSYIVCTYTNWKGETQERKLRPMEVRFGTCEPWHPEPQWLMYAYDMDKKICREFAMNKMTNVKEEKL